MDSADEIPAGRDDVGKPQPASHNSCEARLRGWATGLLIAGVIALATSAIIINWDQALSRSVRSGDVPGDVRKAIELSEAFAHGSGVTAILITLLLATRRPRASLWVVTLMTALCGLSANLLKAAFTRGRPYTHDSGPKGISDVTGWQFLGTGSFWDASQRSFPSGHTATAWGLAFGLSLLYPRATAMFLFLALMATYQRLHSGSHYPSDTVAGFGIACLACAAVLFVPRLRRALCTARN